MKVKNAICAVMAVVTCATANATTYWARLTSSGSIPACLTFYSDEACTSQVSVTPTANDGNTYVFKDDKTGAGSYQTTVNNYTANAGNTWVLGTQSARPQFMTNAGTYNFGNCTINGLAVKCNSYKGTNTWGGVNTFVKSDNKIVFGAASGSAIVRGFNFAGTFISDGAVTVQFGSGWGCTLGSAYVLSGDFTAYQGKFLVSASDGGPLTLSLTSASAFGASSATLVSDYIKVSGGDVTLFIDPAATGNANKGITLDLAEGQTTSFRVDAGKSVTLVSPISGSAGTLAKTGAGTLTLAASVETENISVDAGTLIVDSTASFAPGTTLTISNGATVVSRVGSNIPNVTLNVEEGGSFTYDFTVPFNGTSVTTMDYTSLTAADRALLTKPIAITLSQKITLPQNTAMNLAVARFSASAGFEAADFTDGTEKTRGLPNTSFSMSQPVDGVVTLTMAVKPAIMRNSNGQYSPLNAQYTYVSGAYTTTPVWSDGLAAHSGADYYNTWGAIQTAISSWDSSTQTFAGDSLYLSQELLMYSAAIVLPPTTFASGFSIRESNHWKDLTRKYSGGPYTLLAGASFTLYGVASWLADSFVYRYELEAPFKGEGTLNLSCKTLSTNPSYVTGDNSQLKGKVVVTHADSPSGVSESARLEVALGSSLGGAMDAFTADGIMITKYSIVRPRQTMSLNAVNRGVTIDGCGGFDVGDGKVLTIANPIALTGESGSLIKIGAGMLKLDGAVTREGSNTIAVNEGWLMVPGEDVATAADVAFEAGAGLAIDVEAVSANGLKLTGTAALTFADSKLKVRFANTAVKEQAHVDFSVPICTLPDDTSLTESSFEYVRSCRGFDVTIAKETLGNGYVRFVANCVPKGAVVIVL